MINSQSVNKNIGRNVKKLRKAKGITQEQLAEAIDVQRNFITSIETGKTFISCEVLVKLSNYFNVEPAFFFKSTFIEETDKIKNLKKEILRLLSDCSQELIERIYNIIIALKK